MRVFDWFGVRQSPLWVGGFRGFVSILAPGCGLGGSWGASWVVGVVDHSLWAGGEGAQGRQGGLVVVPFVFAWGGAAGLWVAEVGAG